ncbi:acetyl-CoA-benzylalcohol acetyltransferase-like [Populus nigra]|uniref:acetyl-CoA-benzylalcohol acetyltransferase-like n=1 Tax=Populus nigra TaxID=3691 RepID=UPI002B279890|nr:acetyl-CoA-benzylalcohol acetyltransferase-like [Populus nigra]
MEVQITSRKLIKPSVQTPPHLQILKLSILDQYSYYVPNIFYYTNANHEIENINAQKLVEQLEKSLLEVLTLFYQEPKPYELLRRLVPSLAESATSPLLAVQVNICKCGGLAIGVLNSHRIAGTWTMSRFINAWATTHFHDHGISKVTPPTFVSPFILPDSTRLRFPVPPPPRMASKKIVTKIFRFDREAIEKLKSKVISGADSGVKHHPSRVEVVSALIWKALISVAKEKHGYLRSSSMSLPFNLRGKVGVPLDNQCGNLCRPIIARFDAKNQSKLVLSELVSLIGDAKRRASSECVKAVNIPEMFSMVTNSFAEMFEELNKSEVDIFSFTSWCRMGLYEVDFGWGKPAWVSVVPPNIELTILNDTKSGDGIEAWLNLHEKDMIQLQQDPDIMAFTS